jgi:hypothetical protein
VEEEGIAKLEKYSALSIGDRVEISGVCSLDRSSTDVDANGAVGLLGFVLDSLRH